MTLVVGTNTYLTEAEADTYWAARTNTVWSSASTAEKEKALLEGTQYIDNAFSFIGAFITTNTLAWPRNGVYIARGNFIGQTIDNTTVPQQVKDALSELALDALTARLVETQSRGGAIKREKVDVVEVEYMDWAPSGKTFKFATMLLKPLTKNSSNMKGLVRS